MSRRLPGPMCCTRIVPDWLDDGTICRQRSDPPGPIGTDQSFLPAPKVCRAEAPDYYVPRTQQSFLEPAYATKVNDERVARIIEVALDTAQRYLEIKLKVKRLMKIQCCDVVQQAFSDTRDERQRPGKSLDLNLAAAEYYLFSRIVVCLGEASAEDMKMLALAYEYKKRWDYWRNRPNDMAVTDNPTSPPSRDVTKWGFIGTVHGEQDRKRCNKDAEPPVFLDPRDIWPGYSPY